MGSAAAGQVDGELGEGCVGNHESRVWRRRRAHLQAASSDAIIGLPAWGRDAPVNPIVLIVSLLMSLPDAVSTRAYTPILAIGAGGGVIVGLAAEWWAK